MTPMEDAPEPAVAGAAACLVEERNRNEAVRQAVLALPLRYREPVVLYYFHEMDVEAAARTLKMPTGTLKARLKRGRAIF